MGRRTGGAQRTRGGGPMAKYVFNKFLPPSWGPPRFDPFVVQESPCNECDQIVQRAGLAERGRQRTFSRALLSLPLDARSDFARPSPATDSLNPPPSLDPPAPGPPPEARHGPRDHRLVQCRAAERHRGRAGGDLPVQGRARFRTLLRLRRGTDPIWRKTAASRL